MPEEASPDALPTDSSEAQKKGAGKLAALIDDLSFVQHESTQSLYEIGESMNRLQSDTQALHQLLIEIASKLDNNQDGNAGLYAKLDHAHKAAVTAEEIVVTGTEEQKRLGEQAKHLIANISEGAVKTQQVSRAISILSMNANIEAYRLGMQGRAINVITNEFKSVSSETSKLNDMITTTAQKVNEILPRIDTLSAKINENASQGIRDIIESLDVAVFKFSEIIDGVRANTAATTQSASAIQEALSQSIVSLQHADRSSQVIERVKAGLVEILQDIDPAKAADYRSKLGVITTSSALTNQDPNAQESGEINFL